MHERVAWSTQPNYLEWESIAFVMVAFWFTLLIALITVIRTGDFSCFNSKIELNSSFLLIASWQSLVSSFVPGNAFPIQLFESNFLSFSPFWVILPAIALVFTHLKNAFRTVLPIVFSHSFLMFFVVHIYIIQDILRSFNY